MTTNERIVKELETFQKEIVDNLVNQMRQQPISYLSKKASDGAGDVSYVLDKKTDSQVQRFMKRFTDNIGSVNLIIEGSGSGAYGSKKIEDCDYVVIVDPTDGTRGLMYGIRSAYSLAGVAKNKPGATLKDIEVAVQTEIPTTKQYSFDSLTAIKNHGAKAFRNNLFTNEKQEWKPQPSKAKDLKHGFVAFSKFFEGAKTKTSEIEEKLYKRLGLMIPGKAMTFDDQYISSGGQIANLLGGQYRLVADLRPHFSKGLCAHPYDMCTKLIGDEIGVKITDTKGRKLDAPLDTETNVAWIGYANDDIRKLVEPDLLDIIEKNVPNY